MKPADEQVLDLVFSGPVDGYTFSNPNLYNTDNSDSACEDKKIDFPSNLTQLELVGVRQAENEDIYDSITTFNQLIKECPTYYSAYNNRAQSFRLLNKNDNALQDLDFVIENCKDKDVLKQSYIQRAILLKPLKPDASYSDFCKAANLGQEIAQRAVIEENPLKKLCSSMVQQVMAADLSK